MERGHGRGARPAPPRSHQAVTDVAFSPDGKTMASGSEDRTIRLWRRLQASVRGKPLNGHEDAVTAVAFSPTGEVAGVGER